MLIKIRFSLLLLLYANIVLGQKPIVLWMDASDNFQRLSTPDSIRYYFDKCKTAGVTDVVIDVKPITGQVLYKSQYAPELKTWKSFTRAMDFDFLQICIGEGQKRGLKVHASINIFSGGHSHFKEGIVYTDTNKANWQTILYTDSGMMPITKIKQKYSVMLNPANPEVVNYENLILEELVTKYPDLYGIVLDRVRFDGIESDFSDLSKKAFEEYIGKKINNFPQCVFTYKKEKGKTSKQPGSFYKLWIEWRASLTYHYIQNARTIVKKANPKIQFEDYTGAWYPTYYEVGVNWASKKFRAHKQYKWATKKYGLLGYAEMLDIYMNGCYFYEIMKQEVMNNNKAVALRNEAGMTEEKALWYSVEGSIEMAQSVLLDKNILYASIYVEQYKNNAEQCKKAMQLCLDKTSGLMIFDLVHIVDWNWWALIGQLVNGKMN
jgi:Domain of unknown function/Glycosyl hydrolase-like 10